MNRDRTLLTDGQWAQLEPQLPGGPNSRGVTARDTRRFVEAVLWVGRTGAPWRDLPPHLGDWHRVYVRYSRWEKSGVWDELMNWLMGQRLYFPILKRYVRRAARTPAKPANPRPPSTEPDPEAGRSEPTRA